MGEPAVLDHTFEEGDGSLQLRVALPMIQSMEEVHLEVGQTKALEVRLFVAGTWHCLKAPGQAQVAGEALAKFSRRRKELTISWSLEKPATDGYPSGVTEQSSANGPAEWLAQSGEAPAPAFGSIWNKNSWHWEEKNCIDLATAEVQKILEENPIWKHVPQLSGASFVFKDLLLKGDASFALRKQKRLLCYELSATFKWEGRDEFGHFLGVKGTAQVDGITPEDEEEPDVRIEISTAARHGGNEAKFAGQWMKGTGANYLRTLLCGRSLAPLITAAEVKQARPVDEEMERRRLEEQKAKEAASAAAQQHRISEEARQQELQQRAMRPSSESVSGSVWNVNGWHWEEKPMTDFSIRWLSREFQGLSLRLLSGLAELEFRDVQVTGDASVTVRKGKPIILYLLRLESRWEAAGTAQGLGEAKGSLILPEFSSEDGPKSSVIQVETTSDTSRHRLGSAMRKEGIPAIRALLLRFEEALRDQLPKVTVL